MNKIRKEQIKLLKKELTEINNKLETIYDTECNVRDNTPESLQETERYTNCEECCDLMEGALDHIGEAIENLEVI